jgi:hypothetical protein
MLDGLDVDLWPVGIVVSEAVTNVVLHAYRDSESGRVRVSAFLQDTVLTLVVADDGVGISPNPDSASAWPSSAVSPSTWTSSATTARRSLPACGSATPRRALLRR